MGESPVNGCRMDGGSGLGVSTGKYFLCISSHKLSFFFNFQHWLMQTCHENICKWPSLSQGGGVSGHAGLLHFLVPWKLHSLKSHFHPPTLSPKPRSKLSLFFEHRISESDPDETLMPLKTALGFVLISLGLRLFYFISFLLLPQTQMRFRRMEEFIRALEMVKNATQSENSTPKELLKCPISARAGLPGTHQVLFFHTLFNLILEHF